MQKSLMWMVRMAGVLFSALALVTLGLTPTFAQAPQGGAPPAGGQQGQQGQQGRGGGGGRGPQTPPLLMTTTAWEDGGVIPDKYTQAAGPMAVSPELKWSQVPMGTQSFVLLVHDPEPVLNKGSKMDITHWLIWNIPGTSTGLAEGVAQGELPDGSRQVSLRSNGYMGPGAPAGPYHHYTFELYALDTKLDVPQGMPQQAADTRTAVFNAMDGHVLGKAVLVARFHR
jgi:Raf kinase inhibitor-like YbhB/YbcL family protein